MRDSLVGRSGGLVTGALLLSLGMACSAVAQERRPFEQERGEAREGRGGIIERLEQVELREQGETQTLAIVRLQDGSTVVVDLGPDFRLEELGLREGDEMIVRARGSLRSQGRGTVLSAQRIQLRDDETILVDVEPVAREDLPREYSSFLRRVGSGDPRYQQGQDPWSRQQERWTQQRGSGWDGQAQRGQQGSGWEQQKASGREYGQDVGREDQNVCPHCLRPFGDEGGFERRDRAARRQGFDDRSYGQGSRSFGAKGARVATETVEGDVIELDRARGTVVIEGERGVEVLNGTPQQLERLKQGGFFTGEVEDFGGERWIAKERGFQGESGYAGRFGTSERSITGYVEEVNRSTGLIRIEGQVFKAHPAELEQLRPGQQLTVEYTRISGLPWATSIERSQPGAFRGRNEMGQQDMGQQDMDMGMGQQDMGQQDMDMGMGQQGTYRLNGTLERVTPGPREGIHRLRLDDGRSVDVHLGRRADPEKLGLTKGAEIELNGRTMRIDGREVVHPQRLVIDGNTYRMRGERLQPQD